MIRQYRYNEISVTEIMGRKEEHADVSEQVARILADVRREQDAALFRYGAQFDQAVLDTLEVTEQERKQALAEVDDGFLDILRTAAANIRAFHEKQKRQGFVITETNGVVLGSCGHLCAGWDGKLSFYGADGCHSGKDRRC